MINLKNAAVLAGVVALWPSHGDAGGLPTPVLDTAELRLEASTHRGGGTWLDGSGHGHHGDIDGATWQLDAYGTARFWFDGSDSIVVPDHPDLDFASGQPFTLAVAAQVPVGPTGWDRIVDKRGADSAPGYALLMDQNSGNLGAQVYDQGATGTWLPTYLAVNDGKRHVYILRGLGDGVLNFFLDGAYRATSTHVHGSLANDLDLHIGVHADGAWNHLTGAVYGVALFRAALTEDQISALASEMLGAPLQAEFENVTASRGLGNYSAQAGDGHGPGAVFTDLDGDGYADLYLMRAWGNPNELYVNTDAGGQRTFVRAPGDGGAGDTRNATGAIAGDYDNDGDLDLYVLNFDQANALYANQLVETGSLAFVDVTAGTDPTPGINDGQDGVGMAWWEGIALDNSLTAAWGDPDRDGDLDLYVGNHNGYFNTPVEGPFDDLPGRRDVFYMNNGDGTFTDVTMTYEVPGYVTAGGGHQTGNQRYSSSNAVIFADFDNDGWPDLFVTNKVGGPDDRDMLYMNRGADAGGVWLGFDQVSYALVPNFGTASGAAMGVDVADVDHDGDLDIYITDWSNLDDPYATGGNDLWVNQLADTGALGFVHDTTRRALYSWGAQFQDFDNDGVQDLHVATQGPARDYMFMNQPWGTLEQAQLAGIAQTGNGRGDVSADFDRDGWIDLMVVNLGGSSVLWANRSSEIHPDRHWLHLQLAGDPDAAGPLRSSRDAIGARVRVVADVNGDGDVTPDEVQLREVVSGSSNAASTSSLALEYGLGDADAAQVRIDWPGGRVSVLQLGVDQTVVIDEQSFDAADVDGDGDVDVDDLLAILLSWGACPPGPPLCPTDLNGDGEVDVDDLVAVILGWG